MQYTYFFFHNDDMEDVVNLLKDLNISLSSRFRKYRHTSAVATSETIFLGKFENIAFIISTQELDLDFDFLKEITVEVTEPENTFYESRLCKFAVEEDGSKIKVDRNDEDLIYDFIPAIEIEMIKAEILLNECNLQADVISKEETKIISEVRKLSDDAKKATNVSSLEEILSQVTEFHVEFFKKFMNFKDLNEEMYSSVMSYDVFARNMGGWFSEIADNFKDYFERLKYFESKFEQTISAVRDLFTLVSLRLDMLRNSEYLELQRRTSSLQAAAAVIEFVAVFYYTLQIWNYFLPVGGLHPALSFSLLTIFTTTIVIYTEAISEMIRERKINIKFIFLTLLLAVILILMAIIPLIFSGGAAPSGAH
ncbi:MAG: hypothetical protein R6U44_03730 [Archaeoglobaceae archaeon]